MIKLSIIVGARPQFIKASALLNTIRKHFNNHLKFTLIHSGQHYDKNMSDVFYKTMQIDKPNYQIKSKQSTQGAQTSRMLEAIEQILSKEKPHWCVVFGDTNTTLAGALAASKLHIPIAHVEAGMRSYNKTMPEEINRIFTDHCSTVLFVPSQSAMNNLQKEGFYLDSIPPYSINNPAIVFTGDIMYEVYLNFIEQLNNRKSNYDLQEKVKNKFDIVCTIHRQENTDNEQHLYQIMLALLSLAQLSYRIIFPIHPRTQKIISQSEKLQKIFLSIKQNKNIHVSEPLSYEKMMQILQHVQIVLTDSGGLQKEAFYAQKPCVILRNETEWTEIIQCGAATIAGTDNDNIVNQTIKLINNLPTYFPEIFGNGKTSHIICQWFILNS